MTIRQERLMRRKWNEYKNPILFLVYVISIGYSCHYFYNWEIFKGIVSISPAVLIALLVIKKKIK